MFNGHTLISGNTGFGKTQCCTLPLLEKIAKANETVICVDSKGEAFHSGVINRFIHYEQLYCFDLSNPSSSPSSFNPLRLPYMLFKSGGVEEKDTAAVMVENFVNSIIPEKLNKEDFWNISARQFLKGIILLMIEALNEEYISIQTLISFLDKAEAKLPFRNSSLKEIYQILPENSMARHYLSAYVNAANDTRKSIFAVTSAAMDIFYRSTGILQFLCNDTLDLGSLDIEIPFAVFIILPDNTQLYDGIGGLLISQIVSFLMLKARQYKNGMLPVKTHILLEELGSVGKAIPELPRLAAQSRSRNIQLTLIIQSHSQLIDVYGKAQADTIRSCIQTVIAFSSSSFEEMEYLSICCGDEWVEKNGIPVKEKLFPPETIAAMPRGTALIIIENRIKYITKLPFYYKTHSEETSTPVINKHSVFSYNSIDLETVANYLLSVSPKKPELPIDSTKAIAFREKKAQQISNLVQRINNKIEQNCSEN